MCKITCYTVIYNILDKLKLYDFSLCSFKVNLVLLSDIVVDNFRTKVSTKILFN